MAFTDREREVFETAVADYVERRRPPENIRSELDLAYRIEGQSFIIYEIRPYFRDPGSKIESPVAKTTYVRNRNLWNIYWMRRDLKWHGYNPHPTAKSIVEFLRILDEDAYGCFRG